MHASSLPTLTILFLLSTLTFSHLIRVPFHRHHRNRHAHHKFLDIFQLTPGAVELDDYSDTDHVGTVSIGTPAVNFTVLFDTGSAQLWVPNASLASQVKDSFNCSASTTCRPNTNDFISISYGEGGFEGFQFSDDLHLGNLTIPNFNMIAAVEINGIPNKRYDGILGLGIGRYLRNFPTVLEALTSNGIISAGTFSMYLGQNMTAEGSPSGEVIFGGYDPMYAASPFQFVSVEDGNKTLLWTANMTAMGMGIGTNVSDVENFYVIFDSGTSYTLFPESFIQNVVQQATQMGINCTYNNLSRLYNCDCVAQYVLPNLYFYFENATFDVPATSYIVPRDGVCVLAMQALYNPVMGLYNPAVLGDVFLKNYYGLYSQDNFTVGFARAAVIESGNSSAHSHKWWIGIAAIIAGLLAAFHNRHH